METDSQTPKPRGVGSSDLLGQWLARMKYEVREEWKLFEAQRLLDHWGYEMHFFANKYHRYVCEQRGIHGRIFCKPRLWKRLVAKLAQRAGERRQE